MHTSYVKVTKSTPINFWLFETEKPQNKVPAKVYNSNLCNNWVNQLLIVIYVFSRFCLENELDCYSKCINPLYVNFIYRNYFCKMVLYIMSGHRWRWEFYSRDFSSFFENGPRKHGIKIKFNLGYLQIMLNKFEQFSTLKMLPLPLRRKICIDFESVNILEWNLD